MSEAAARVSSDKVTGDGRKRRIVASPVRNVFINGNLAVGVGSQTGDGAVITGGSGSVIANGVPLSRKGDTSQGGSESGGSVAGEIASGSTNVFIG